jgi:hypothetical protein
MKIFPAGAELFHADRETDMTLIVDFHNFAKAPKNCSSNCLIQTGTDKRTPELTMWGFIIVLGLPTNR